MYADTLFSRRVVSSSPHRRTAAQRVRRLLLLAMIGGGAAADASCPLYCACDMWYGLKRLSCVGRHLYSIHTGAPDGARALDLSNNSISLLRSHDLAGAGMSQLKYLNLSMNAISEIGLYALDGLADLAVLDLSWNHLYYLLPETFVPATSLRILRLSRNNFNSHLPRLQCPWLTELMLDSCLIDHVPADSFVGLTHLRDLDLSHNLIIQLDSGLLRTLTSLRSLTIDGNPLPCDQLARDLLAYLGRRNIHHRLAVCKSAATTTTTTTTTPRKFEKMIVYDGARSRQKDSSRRRPGNNGRSAATWPAAPAPTDTQVVVEGCTTNGTDFARTLSALSPYWFFAVGFAIGSACSMLACYLWLTRTAAATTTTMTRRRWRRVADGCDAQRISLLRHLWQHEDAENEERGTISCPGTPPPPYREVVTRPGLYRSPVITTSSDYRVEG